MIVEKQIDELNKEQFRFWVNGHILILDSYYFDKSRNNIVLRLHPKLSPIKAAIFPIVKTDEKVVSVSREIFSSLKKDFDVLYDDGGSVGRRYSRNDESGTPFCITYDFDSVEDGAVTVRDRDTMEQERIKIEDLKDYFAEKFNY